MFDRAHRVPRVAFEPLVRQGKTARSAHGILRYVYGDATKPAQCAVVVSAKTISLAVGRNRAKRQARAVIETFLPSLPRGLQCALFIQKGFDTLAFSDIEKEIKELFAHV